MLIILYSSLSAILQIPHISRKRLFSMYANCTVKARGSEDKIVALLALILYAFFK